MTLATKDVPFVFVGAKVRLVDLQARKELNGKVARVVSKYEGEEPVRWGVDLGDMSPSESPPSVTRLKVKTANLRVVEWCESVLASVGNLQRKGSLVRRAGQRYRPGDVFVQAGKGAYDALIELARGSTLQGDLRSVDVWVRYACLIQLAKLAACPLHRPAFLGLRGEGGGIRVLCDYASIPVTEYDASFPPRKSLEEKSTRHQLLAKAFEQLVGKSYGAVHPKCVLAKAFAALTEYQSCCSPPCSPTGRVLLQNRYVMDCLGKLSEETCWCVTSQKWLAITAKALVEEVVRGQEKEIMLAIDHGLFDTMSKLIRAAKENEDSPCAESLTRLLNSLHIHPSHPQNQVPTP